MRSNLLAGSLFINKITLVRIDKVLIERLDPSNLQNTINLTCWNGLKTDSSTASLALLD
jgi:hypothetical protein